MKCSTIVIGLALAVANAAAAAAGWTLDPAGSTLAFTASFENTPAPGRFRRFQAAVSFDPDRLAASRIDVTIVTASADMDSDDINKAIVGADWFDAVRFPTAEFHAAEVLKVGDDRYVASGTLTIKGVSNRLDLPFAWKAQGDRATMTGELTIARAAYRIGLGEWEGNPAIGPQVTVKFAVRLRKDG